MYAWSPSASLSAAVSAASLSGVEVPWALTYTTSSGVMPASFIAAFIAREGPPPVLSGAVRWYASADAP